MAHEMQAKIGGKIKKSRVVDGVTVVEDIEVESVIYVCEPPCQFSTDDLTEVAVHVITNQFTVLGR